jgi:hypothetical protein
MGKRIIKEKGDCSAEEIRRKKKEKNQLIMKTKRSEQWNKSRMRRNERK